MAEGCLDERLLRFFDGFHGRRHNNRLRDSQAVAQHPNAEPPGNLLFPNAMEASLITVPLGHGLFLSAQNLSPAKLPGSIYLCNGNLFGLQTLGPAFHDKRHLRALFERAVAAGFDGREMYENIFTVLTRNESKAFAGVEPLHRSCFFHDYSF